MIKPFVYLLVSKISVQITIRSILIDAATVVQWFFYFLD